MAIEVPVGPFSLKAGVTLTAKQYCFAKLTADLTAGVCTSSLDAPLGIIQNAPVTNDGVALMGYGISKVLTGAAVTVGNWLSPDANGAAVPITFSDTTKFIGAVALETAGTGAYVSAFLPGISTRAN